MGNVRIVLNHDAVADLLKSEAVADDLLARAEKIANAAGEGFETNVEIGENRARAEVRTSTFEGRKAAADGALNRALDAGR